jgi:hypothetical protein
MRIPAIEGMIDRRILANYRVDPSVAARLLPARFQPRIVRGWAMAGICLIRLRNIRPAALPMVPGIASENAAHRFAVNWEQNGQKQHGVFIPRRDSSSCVNVLLGGRLVPGEHHHARFVVSESFERLDVAFRSDDGKSRARVFAQVVDALPSNSIFSSLDEASDFFEQGSLGYSATAHPQRFDGLELRCKRWVVEPLTVEAIESSFFDDPDQFPAGSVEFDCALLMRNIEHEWHSLDPICCTETASA